MGLQLLQRRLQGEPVAYILGNREFYGLDFSVAPGVLIPRPDTETLVEAALQLIPETSAGERKGPLRILDLGTGSGAIAIATANRVLMLEYSVYSVISPEGCAAILWKDASQRERAAEALKITAEDLLRLHLIDEIVKEPVGGAHVDPDATGEALRDALIRHVGELKKLRTEKLLRRRSEKYAAMGVYSEA